MSAFSLKSTLGSSKYTTVEVHLIFLLLFCYTLYNCMYVLYIHQHSPCIWFCVLARGGRELLQHANAAS